MINNEIDDKVFELFKPALFKEFFNSLFKEDAQTVGNKFSYSNSIENIEDDFLVESKVSNYIVKNRYFYFHTEYKQNNSDDFFAQFTNGGSINSRINQIKKAKSKEQIGQDNYKNIKYEYILITLLNKQDIEIIENIKNLNERYNIKILGVNEVRKIISKNRMLFINILSNKYPLELLISEIEKISLYDRDEYNFKKERMLLNSVYKEDNVALVLGAGVSIDCGAKSWDDLMKLYSDQLSNSTVKLVDNIKDLSSKVGGESNLIMAQLVKDVLDFNYKPYDYYRILHDGLYKPNLGYKDKNFKSAELLNIPEKFILHHIAKVVEKNMSKRLFKVMTYNYDNFLEFFIDNLNNTKLRYKTLYSQNVSLEDCIPIYHVHGYLPYSEAKTQMHESHLNSVILTEQDYNNLYNDPYRWEITTQLSIYRENICLFIGLSLKDPNLRRLIKIAKKEKREHFSILNKPTNISVIDLITIEKHFLQIGIKIIWTDDYGIELLKKMY